MITLLPFGFVFAALIEIISICCVLSLVWVICLTLILFVMQCEKWIYFKQFSISLRRRRLQQRQANRYVVVVTSAHLVANNKTVEKCLWHHHIIDKYVNANIITKAIIYLNEHSKHRRKKTTTNTHFRRLELLLCFFFFTWTKIVVLSVCHLWPFQRLYTRTHTSYLVNLLNSSERSKWAHRLRVHMSNKNGLFLYRCQ